MAGPSPVVQRTQVLDEQWHASGSHSTRNSAAIPPLDSGHPVARPARRPRSAPPIVHLHSRLHATVAATVASIPDAPRIVVVWPRGDPGVELARVATDGAMLVLGDNSHSRVTESPPGRVVGECLRGARWSSSR